MPPILPDDLSDVVVQLTEKHRWQLPPSMYVKETGMDVAPVSHEYV